MSIPELLGGLEIRVNGRPLDPTVTDRLIDARVQDNLMLPDAFQLRLRDPHFELVDGTTFDIGAKVELRYAPPSSTAPVQPVVSGEVATIAPEFEHDGCVLVVRGYDISHKLNRTRRSRTFQDMTASDIAVKVVGDSGLDVEAESTSEVYPFE
jgi:hypothetical protein